MEIHTHKLEVMEAEIIKSVMFAFIRFVHGRIL